MRPILDRLVDAIEQVLIEYKREKKVAEALASVKKAKERGSFLGRNKKRDDDLIWDLYGKGLTVRAIAKQAGVSATVVQRSLTSAKANKPW